jgi:hypothetical protein
MFSNLVWLLQLPADFRRQRDTRKRRAAASVSALGLCTLLRSASAHAPAKWDKGLQYMPHGAPVTRRHVCRPPACGRCERCAARALVLPLSASLVRAVLQPRRCMHRTRYVFHFKHRVDAGGRVACTAAPPLVNTRAVGHVTRCSWNGVLAVQVPSGKNTGE